MDIREMRETEVEQVGKLHNELAYYIQKETKDVYFDFTILDLNSIAEHLKKYTDDPFKRIYVAEINREIVGFIAGEIINCYLPISSINKVGYISGAYIIPIYRGQGIMKKLESKIVNFFKENGIEFAEVNFISENLFAKNCWEGLGYSTFREQARKKL